MVHSVASIVKDLRNKRRFTAMLADGTIHNMEKLNQKQLSFRSSDSREITLFDIPQ